MFAYNCSVSLWNCSNTMIVHVALCVLMTWGFSTMVSVAHVLSSSQCVSTCLCVNTLRPRQQGRRFADDTFKLVFSNENVRISIKISLKFVPKGPINNNPALVQIMAWRRPGDKPLSETMMVTLLTHICVTRPQWVKTTLGIWANAPRGYCRSSQCNRDERLFKPWAYFIIMYRTTRYSTLI